MSSSEGPIRKAAESSTRADESGAGWSEQPPPTGTSDGGEGFATAEHARYQRGDEIGRGGMGRVYQSTDRRLGREVALKEIAPNRTDPGFVDRLIREARLTAYLDHPNIVPVYDAGKTEAGRIFYTMRLIRGRSLALAIGDEQDRETLLRHYLHACQAVAFAHSRGVVHRDLKPANIMVGAFGETQVVDWGLAGLVEDQVDDTIVEKLGVGPTGPLGTKAYMAPEQATAGPIAAQADVYSLGVVLREFTGDDAESELRAIATKATATKPTLRYSDASALSEDIARYLDGRRVLAHNYSAGELLRRLIRLWRVPLGIGLIAFLALAIAISIMVTRISRERGRAVDAEASARQALTENRRALNRQALAAFQERATAEAEVIAAHALKHGEFADARGVLAAAHAGSRPSASKLWTLPGCARAEPSRTNRALCVENSHVSLWQLADPPRRQWRVPASGVRAYLTSAYVVLVGASTIDVLAVASGKTLTQFRHTATRFAIDRQSHTLVAANNRLVWAYDLAHGRKQQLARPCDPDLVSAVAASPTRVVALCKSGTVVVFAASTGLRTHTVTTPFDAARPALAVALSGDGERVAVGGARGGVAVVGISTPVPSKLRTLISGPIQQLAFYGNDFIVVVPESGAATVRSISGGVTLLRLPAGAHSVVAHGSNITAAGARIARWTIAPTRLVGSIFTAGAGLSSAAVSPDGASIVAARGDGVLSSWRRVGARLVADVKVDKAVLKRVVYPSDGAQVVVATASQKGSAVVDTASSHVVKTGTAKQPLRRVIIINHANVGPTVVGLGYRGGLITWRVGDDNITNIAGPRFMDASTASNRSSAVLLDEQGGVWRIDDLLTLQKLRSVPGAVAVAADTNNTTAVATQDGVHVFGRSNNTAPRWLPSISGGVTDVAISPDGRFIVAASRRGTVDVWRAAESKVVAVLRGHRQRVAYVAFSKAHELVSASWDGSVRMWNLDVIDLPARELIDRAHRAWALGLDDALRAWPLGSVANTDQ